MLLLLSSLVNAAQYSSVNLLNNNLSTVAEQSSIPEQPERPSIKLNWNQNESAYKKKMSNSETSEIVIPTLVIVGLLVLNAFILLIILRCRNKRLVIRADKNDLSSSHLNWKIVISSLLFIAEKIALTKWRNYRMPECWYFCILFYI